MLRDTDNIAMYLGIEARNPLLSPEAMLSDPDFKVAMSHQVATQHGVSFGPKQGFNYGEDQAGFLSLCQRELPGLVKQYPQFQAMTDILLQQNPIPFASVKKVYMLLKWLGANAALDRDIGGPAKKRRPPMTG